MPGPVVVKFGGSLSGSPDLRALLGVTARHGAVVAPGGGRFADAVRAAQAELGFSDEAAHRMAILAMDQTAEILAELAPSLPLAGARLELIRGSSIWRPSPMALGADVPCSWNVTSDSLAVWLGVEIAAPQVILLKSAAADAGADLKTLREAGVVDPYLPQIAARFSGTISVLGPAAPDALHKLLSSVERRAA
ncbi:hypothetical protein IHQ68_14510 [Chelatococcus sambhunathii]|uniref:Aspartate/glutamate/uridylate kinase domain-containing protein n=1 Tax=Chelatococcus sambhunathii TaxID=363953 RepID=A0ABU1DI85_9HYPH|nr:hypothetical protein [Chelatococcus sambhunathii]MDR4307833.1 hypothetical protein [Chelatococcus sambhunathii]